MSGRHYRAWASSDKLSSIPKTRLVGVSELCAFSELHPTSAGLGVFFKTKKARGFIPGFSPKSRVVAVLEKVLSVLPSTLFARIFLDRLFLSAAECPFFDNFFLWFGSHRSLSYNNMREISPTIFCGRTRLRNP